jgi:predicted nuclease of predicted toxin-antitoxin system
MRFLIDNALSPQLSEALRLVGFDAVHVRDYQMSMATDEEIFNRADREKRIVILADTDFGSILATRGAAKPSLILFRGEVTRRPDEQIDILKKNLAQLQTALDAGSVVAIERGRIRTRSLPLT